MIVEDFSTIDIEATVRELVPKFQQDTVLKVLLKDGFTEADADFAGMALLGDTPKSGFIILTKNAQGPMPQQGRMWMQLKREAYELFCTESKKYSQERKEGAITVKNLVTILASAVGGTFSLPAGVLVGAATLCVMTALKMGLNAYCKVNAPGEK